MKILIVGSVEQLIEGKIPDDVARELSGSVVEGGPAGILGYVVQDSAGYDWYIAPELVKKVEETMSQGEASILLELAKLTILIQKVKQKVPPEILEGLEARVNKIRSTIDPETLAVFDAAASKDVENA